MTDYPGQTSERAPDPRPARTRAAILDAIERLGTSGAEISVAAIVAEAKLSRSSFYSQFKDVGDVAVQLVQEVYEKLHLLDSEARDSKRANEATETSMSSIITEFSTRKHLYAAVLGGGAGVVAHLEVCRIMAEGALKSVGQYVPDGVDAEFASRYLAGGVLSAIIHWLLDETPCSEQQLLEQMLLMLPDWVTSS